MHTNLADAFPGHTGCKTKAGAQRRVSLALARMPSNLDVIHAVIERPNGRWFAVMFLRGEATRYANALCHLNICIYG